MASNLNNAKRASLLTAASEARIRKEAENLNKAMKASVKNEEDRKRAASLKVRVWKFIQKLLTVFKKSGDNRIMKMVKSLLRVYMTRARNNTAVTRARNNAANLRKSTFIQTNVPGNGSCFYHAVILSALGIPPNRNGPDVRHLRTGVKRYLTEYYANRQNNDIVASTRRGNFTKTQFLNGLNHMGCFAGQAEIMAAAHVMGRQIIVLYDLSPGMYGVHPQLTYRHGLPATNPVYIWYNAPPGEFGAHFQSLRRRNA